MDAKRYRAREAEAKMDVAILAEDLPAVESCRKDAARWKLEADEQSLLAAKERAKEKREEYYGDLLSIGDLNLIRHVERTPDKARPKKHTMGREHFLAYIGRYDTVNKRPLRSSKEILCKKFSDQQKRWLQLAYSAGLTVRVIGAPANDYEILLPLRKRQVVNADADAEPVKGKPAGVGERHKRSSQVFDKPFNTLRAQMVWTAPIADTAPEAAGKPAPDELPPAATAPLHNPTTELWLLVFPSPQYVDRPDCGINPGHPGRHAQVACAPKRSN